MLAARAGADKVVGIEQNQHMCEVGEECEVMNGFLPKCYMLHRCASRAANTTRISAMSVDLVYLHVFVDAKATCDEYFVSDPVNEASKLPCEAVESIMTKSKWLSCSVVTSFVGPVNVLRQWPAVTGRSSS